MLREREKELRRNRRNERDRKRRFARKVFSSWSWFGKDTEKHRKWVEEMVRTHADNMQSCSCPMCCSPRSSIYHKGKDKLTMQERKFLEISEDEELFDN
jgi:hypothetical protein